MERYFRTQEGKRVNVVEHTLEQIKKWPNLKMFIGTDAQDYGKITRFVTCVCYRYGSRGAHFVYYLEEVKKMDMYQRLYDEGTRTIEAAQIISNEIPVVIEALEFDYNTIPKWASNKLVSTMNGWAKGLNYKPVFKNTASNIMIATKAADHVCRHPNMYK